MKDVSEAEVKSRMSATVRPWCKTCGKDGWHEAWCPEGPGPAPPGEPGIGYGREEVGKIKREESEDPSQVILPN